MRENAEAQSFAFRWHNVVGSGLIDALNQLMSSKQEPVPAACYLHLGSCTM